MTITWHYEHMWYLHDATWSIIYSYLGICWSFVRYESPCLRDSQVTWWLNGSNVLSVSSTHGWKTQPSLIRRLYSSVHYHLIYTLVNDREAEFYDNDPWRRSYTIGSTNNELRIEVYIYRWGLYYFVLKYLTFIILICKYIALHIHIYIWQSCDVIMYRVYYVGVCNFMCRAWMPACFSKRIYLYSIYGVE